MYGHKFYIALPLCVHLHVYVHMHINVIFFTKPCQMAFQERSFYPRGE